MEGLESICFSPGLPCQELPPNLRTPVGEETHLPALSWVAPLQQDQGAWGDGGGGGSQALPLLLDEMVTEQPRLEDRDRKGQVQGCGEGRGAGKR